MTAACRTALMQERHLKNFENLARLKYKRKKRHK